MTKRYDINKASKVGVEIICPICGKHFIKTSYQQVFCSNDCKNRYWNNKRTNNGYFKQYNIRHPERLQRINIDMERDCSSHLGTDDEIGLAQIEMCPDATQFE